MSKAAALKRLKAIKKPIFVDGGSWQFGHTYFFLTKEGVITQDCTTFAPFQGPFRITKGRLKELRSLAKSDENRNRHFRDGEELLLVHNAEPNEDYWALQPYDDAPLAEWSVSKDHDALMEEWIDTRVDFGPVDIWDQMNEEELERWIEELDNQ